LICGRPTLGGKVCEAQRVVGSVACWHHGGVRNSHAREETVHLPVTDDWFTVRQAIYDRVPDFKKCGGCGNASRHLGEQEAADLLRHAVELCETGPALEVLYALGVIYEVQVASKYGLCTCGPVIPPAPFVPSKGCYLYRLWGEDNRLIYVGVSTNLRARLKTHDRNWGHLFIYSTWEEHPDEESMLAAERKAIQEEFPALNKAGC
jgi:hypothetical protein